MHSLASRAPFVLALVLLSACGGGGGGGGGGGPSPTVVEESEPNDASGTAAALAVGQQGHGSVLDGADGDFWSVALAAGELVSLEVFAQRLDQTGWTAAGNAARVTVYDLDGTSELLRQGDGEFLWTSEQDTDVHGFRAPAAGTYFVRVDGDDTLLAGAEYLLAVGTASQAAPLQLELEPAGLSGLNDDSLSAETIVPGTVAGFFVDDESDWYAFAVSEPSLVTFTMLAHRSGVWQADDSIYDPALTLHDPGLNVLASNDDAFYLDSALRHVLTVPGTYFLAVGECCASGDSGYELEFTSTALDDAGFASEIEPNDSAGLAQTLAFGEFLLANVVPGDEDFYAVDCDAGDRLHVEVFHAGNLQGTAASVVVSMENLSSGIVPDDAGGALSIRRTIVTSTDAYYLHVSSAGTGAYSLRVTRTPAGFESEPNDTAANAGAFDANGRAAGVIASAGDADRFAFAAAPGVPVVFRCLADDVGPHGFSSLDGFGSELDPLLRVRDAGGTILARADALLGTAVGVVDGVATVSLVFLPPASGTCYAEVVDQTGSFGTNFHYVLEMR